MKHKTAHEPKARVMSAAETWEDARQIASVLRQNLLSTEPAVRLFVPLSAVLAALDDLSREDLQVLRQRVEERLAV